MSVKIVNKLKFFRERVDQLSRSSQKKLRVKIKQEGVNIGFDMIRRIRAITPESLTPESTEVIAYREAAWKFFGVQPYLFNTSPIPTLRKHGLTANQGWADPTVNFRGSTTETVQAQIILSNSSSQTHLLYDVLDSVPDTFPQYRKKIMFEGRDGEPVVRQMAPGHRNSSRPQVNIDPIMEDEARRFRNKIDLEQMIVDEFSTL